MSDGSSVTAEVVRAAQEVLDVEKVLLFGSRSKGAVRAESDYDYLIVARSDLPPGQRIDLVRLRLLHIRQPLDILVVTPEEFERFRQWGSTLICEAAATGQVVYEAA